ncbi:hypothetical protein NPIL_513741 [Nephila pilipes]|uniref:Uncharacterized protein n=1 Tax=Nephila pilipes TaxID=299642 RepID=A0A8X6QI10_NEPPI|nr:hypothetical protein NPIL_513741 [Nephila pilipes]
MKLAKNVNRELIIESLLKSIRLKDQMIDTLQRECTELKLEQEELKKNNEYLQKEIKAEPVISYIVNDYRRIESLLSTSDNEIGLEPVSKWCRSLSKSNNDKM